MVDQRQVMNFRVRAQQLDRAEGTLADTAVLDIGVQDTGTDGGRWALAIRGVDVTALSTEELILLWTVRGAPHLYRRADVGKVAAAVEPFSDADAGKRIYDAARPLKAAGIGNLAALDEVAAQMRAVVTAPTVKGDVSGRLAEVMPEPYLRFCRPCDATHLYEMPFRLAAVRAGLELELDTSPPVLHRIRGFKKAVAPGDRFDLVRAYLRLLGPATPARPGRSWPPTNRPWNRPTPRRPACSARSTSSSRPRTGRPWCRTRPAPRSCGRCWADPAQSWSTVNWSAPGVPASPAGR
ncbi:hypothetical protein GCM10027452_21800 [Micromonospora halotolerans]